MKVYVISGHAQNGKDTTGAMLKDCFERAGKKVLIVHYADLLKFICKTFFGWNGEKDEAGRTLLQHVGTDVIRKKTPDLWVNFVIYILSAFDAWDCVIIPDARFPNEIHNLITAGFDVTHIRVIRGGFDNGLTEEQKNHPSETALDFYPADYCLHNNGGLEDLREEVTNIFLEELHREEIYDPDRCR